jgi:HEAT repeat protein
MAVAHAVALALSGLALAGTSTFAWPGAAPSGPAVDLAALDQGTRVRAVLTLAGASEKEAPPMRELLVPMLRDREIVVRETAGRVLAGRGVAEAIDAATAWVASTTARERLAGLHVLRDAPALTAGARRAAERATRDGDLATRRQALEVLAGHDPAASFSVVLAALADEHRDVRARAARALGALGDRRAALPLIARLEDGDRLVRAEAIVALGALGERRALPALLRQLDAPALELRLPAVDAVGALGDAGAVPAVARVAQRRPLDDVGRHAILALGALATPEALEVLRALARDADAMDDVREALARAGAAALPVLRAELAEGTPLTAPLAAGLLGAAGERAATPWLAAAVDARGPAATAAAAALGRLGDEAGVPTLMRAAVARAGDADLRVAALDALAALADDRAAEAALAALGDPDAAVRAAAARAAGACGGPALAPALAVRLSDGDARVRHEAARSLARVAAPASEVARAILAALSRGLVARDEAALDALGDALERSVGPDDARAAEEAYLASGTGSPGRAPLARALAAAHGPGGPTSRPVVDALVGELAGDGRGAIAAADALASARLGPGQEDAVAAAFAAAEPGVAARLAPALARFRAGQRQLAATLRDPDAGAPRRAAAAWALAGLPEGQAALREASSSSEPPVAANARAALAAGPRGPGGWAAVRLVTPTGEPWPRRWVTMTPPNGPAVWVVTDLDGRARLTGAPPGLTVSVPGAPTE